MAQEKKRILDPREMLTTHVLPLTPQQRKLCGAPMLQLNGKSNGFMVKAAGNGMNVPTMGAVMLCAILSLERVPTK